MLEILLATGIFMTVMVVAVGIFTLTISGSSTTEQLRVNTQAVRFAFESMTREIKLARGLVYFEGEVPVMVIPPFRVEGSTILVYQVKKSPEVDAQGQAKYSLSRKSYVYTSSPGKVTLTTEEAYTGADAKTAADIYDLERAQATVWRKVGETAAILPDNVVAPYFSVRRSQAYPALGEKMDTLSVQPFIQLDLQVMNERYNQNKDDKQKIKTTLRTMIVPRNFANPYEVVQPGVQGASN